jgi:hypothetical protein
MKKKHLTKEKYILIAAILLVMLLLLFIRMPAETVKIDYVNYEKKIDFKGIYLAQEFILHHGDVSKSELIFKNGEKVAKGVLVTDSIRSKESGIIVDYLDGYENNFSLEKLNDINEKTIDQVIEKQKELPGIKVLNNSEWYLYSMVDKVKDFKRGQMYDIQLDKKYYSIEIGKVISNSDNTFLLMKLRSDLSTTNLQRGLKGVIIKSRNKGFIVPKKAIIESDGSQGVLVSNSDYAEFRKVKIVHEDNDIYVVIPDDTSKRKLQQYDNVIINPRNIKEGTRVK